MSGRNYVLSYSIIRTHSGKPLETIKIKYGSIKETN